MTPSYLSVTSFNVVKTISGYDLKKYWNRYIDYWFLDEEDDESQHPFPVSEFLFYIESNPKLVYTLFEIAHDIIYVH